MKELGVGITVLPHAMREFTTLGLQEKLLQAGIETQESKFFNRFGQLIYAEPRGKYAGYDYPECAIHRGRHIGDQEGQALMVGDGSTEGDALDRVLT